MSLIGNAYDAGEGVGAGLGIDPARLARANINVRTGLATDYLNHFNEAIMLLDLATAMPECIDDFLAWRPLSYREHFASSSFKERDLAIAAYEASDPQARQMLDEVSTTMDKILHATREGLLHDPDSAEALVAQAGKWLKPLAARAGAIINGQFTFRSCETDTEAPQLAVDRLLQR